MAPKRNPSKKRRLALFFFGLLALGAGAYLQRFVILGAMGDILVKNDQDTWQPGEHVVVLMGDLSSSRATAALKLWQKDPSQKVLMMEEKRRGFVKDGLMLPPSSMHQMFFEKSGVPREKILVLTDCAVDSTLDEARCYYEFLKRQAEAPKRVSLVTSFYHSSRAFWIFDHIFHVAGNSPVKLQMIAAGALAEPSDGGDTQHEALAANQDWWQREDLFLSVFSEYLKWTYWFFKGLPKPAQAHTAQTH